MTSNREDWLHTMASKMTPWFEAQDQRVPTLAISCGFPSHRGLSRKKQVIGQCWDAAATANGIHQIFISPVIPDGLRAADVLVHEICHAVLPPDTKHNKTFASLATKMGLEGKPTATVAGANLIERLNALIADVGTYPHSALLAAALSEKKQSTRMLKVSCECGYTVRMTQKWLDIGAPICPVDGNEMQEVVK